MRHSLFVAELTLHSKSYAHNNKIINTDLIVEEPIFIYVYILINDLLNFEGLFNYRLVNRFKIF